MEPLVNKTFLQGVLCFKNVLLRKAAKKSSFHNGSVRVFFATCLQLSVVCFATFNQTHDFNFDLKASKDVVLRSVGLGSVLFQYVDALSTAINKPRSFALSIKSLTL